MRIGIDASRTFVENPTGTERYAYEITTRILALPEAKKHTWILYTKDNIKLPYLWTQVGLASRTWIDNLDVLWVPAHTLPVLRKPGIKTVVTIHGLEYEWLPAYENPLQRWYLPLSTIYASKSASKVIAVSEFTKQQLVERVGVDEKKIEVIYEGFVAATPLSDLPPNLRGRRKWEVLKRLGLIPKQYILFVGTIQPRKNLVRLIEAFSMIKTDLKLVICGKWGWTFDEIKLAPKKFGVEDKVVFTGYINDTERSILLANALVAVQPSITEGFGLPVLEAMAAGVPVVSSTGGALKEIGTGLFFDPYDVSDMASKIKLLVNDIQTKGKNLRTEVIKRGNERIKDFSWQKAAQETYNVLTGFK